MISVIIPLYNKALYIERAIQSILRQTFLPQEIIVINDGSIDDSANIVKQIDSKKIKLISTINQGECAARNLGINKSRYDLVAFLDADDEWKPGFLEQIKVLIDNFPNCGAYATSFDVIVDNKEVQYPKMEGIPPFPWIGILQNYFKIIQTQYPFYSSSIVIPKAILNKIGGFPVGVQRGGDLITWEKIGLDYPIAYSPSRQVIYHAEACNRVCNTIKINAEIETDRQKFLRGILSEGNIDEEIRRDLTDYYVLALLTSAKTAIMAGKPAFAKPFLERAKKNQKYRTQWYLLKVISFIPSRLLCYLISIKKRVGI